VAGDPSLVGEILQIRKHTGLLVPAPVQAAAATALADDTHVERQRDTYARRRATLHEAVSRAGLRVEHSEAGLYLWATRGEPGRDTLRWFAERGILVAPGDFYGAAGAQHVRIALPATDERIAAAATRLT
jgi:aspartate/methionine/tyrosine aminotransferase